MARQSIEHRLGRTERAQAICGARVLCSRRPMPRTAICAAPRLLYRLIDLYRIVLVSLGSKNRGVFVRSVSLIRSGLDFRAGYCDEGWRGGFDLSPCRGQY